MLNIRAIHHVAIICSDYPRSKEFYTRILGFKIISEHYRGERDSWKLDLGLDNRYLIELFSFPNPPARISRPEACGLRHLAFEVDNIERAVDWLHQNGVATEKIRVDPYTEKKFTFFADPDSQPLELYQF